jgi:hypothetical protein
LLLAQNETAPQLVEVCRARGIAIVDAHSDAFAGFGVREAWNRSPWTRITLFLMYPALARPRPAAMCMPPAATSPKCNFPPACCFTMPALGRRYAFWRLPNPRRSFFCHMLFGAP